VSQAAPHQTTKWPLGRTFSPPSPSSQRNPYCCWPHEAMPFFFTPRDPKYVIYMGKDKYENEELIKYGHPEDIWFHVDELSSAHVYLRVPRGESWEEVPEGVLEDCVQLVKQNSIQGCKLSSVAVIYTPHSNLKKTQGMEVGQVGFKIDKLVKSVKVSKINAILNRLNKTKVEKQVDLQASYEDRTREMRNEEKASKKQKEKEEREQREKQKRDYDIKTYADLQKQTDLLTSNADVDTNYEEDFL